MDKLMFDVVVDNEETDFSKMNTQNKIATIAKLVSSICRDYQKETGGNSMTFTVNEITSKVEPDNSKDTVTITWETV